MEGSAILGECTVREYLSGEEEYDEDDVDSAGQPPSEEGTAVGRETGHPKSDVDGGA